MGSRPTLRVDRTRTDVGVFQLLGEHDMDNAPQLEAAVNEQIAEGRGIVLDLSEVEFIDSSVIHVLYSTERALAGQGRQLALRVNTASVVLRALEASQVTEAIAITPDLDDAIAIATGPRNPLGDRAVPRGDV